MTERDIVLWLRHEARETTDDIRRRRLNEAANELERLRRPAPAVGDVERAAEAIFNVDYPGNKWPEHATRQSARKYREYARAALSAVQADRDAVIREAIYTVDTELENGSPKHTWDGDERAIDGARERAILALEGLLKSPATGDKNG